MTEPSRAAAVAALFTGAVAYELWGEGDPATLHPEEAGLVASAVESRRRQFAAGRSCAHRALADLGIDPPPLLRASGRAPRWPEGITGSISHTEDYAVAVVARLDGRPSPGSPTVGIDAERIGRVGEHLYRRLFLPDEQEHLLGLTEPERAEAATVMFGVKESFYKAQFAVTGAWVGFHDVELRPGRDGYRLHRASDLEVLDRFSWPGRGRHVVRRGVAVTAVEATLSRGGSC